MAEDVPCRNIQSHKTPTLKRSYVQGTKPNNTAKPLKTPLSSSVTFSPFHGPPIFCIIKICAIVHENAPQLGQDMQFLVQILLF